MAKRKSTNTGSGQAKRPKHSSGSGFGRSEPVLGAVKLRKVDPDGDLLLKFSCSSGVESQAEEPVFNVHMRVSSKHLTIVSPVFKAMLQRDNFREGRELGNTGSVTVPLADDDPDAFIIILDVVHCRSRQVPREISLEMLTRISVLVDKYQMVEAVEMFSNDWIQHIKFPDPESGDIHGLPDAYESLEQQRTIIDGSGSLGCLVDRPNSKR
jgi:BTB/POZ domain